MCVSTTSTEAVTSGYVLGSCRKDTTVSVSIRGRWEIRVAMNCIHPFQTRIAGPSAVEHPLARLVAGRRQLLILIFFACDDSSFGKVTVRTPS